MKKNEEKIFMLDASISDLMDGNLNESLKTLHKLLKILSDESYNERMRREKYKHMRKALIFVEHVEEHLKIMYPSEMNAKVMCKICGKTIDEIYEEDEPEWSV